MKHSDERLRSALVLQVRPRMATCLLVCAPHATYGHPNARVLQRFARGCAGRAVFATVFASMRPAVVAAVRIQTRARVWLARRRVAGVHVTRIAGAWRSRRAVWERRELAAAAVGAEFARSEAEDAVVRARGEEAKNAAMAFQRTKLGGLQVRAR